MKYIAALNQRWEERARFAAGHFCRWLREHVDEFRDQSAESLNLAAVTRAHVTAYVSSLEAEYPNANTRRGIVIAIRRWFQFLCSQNHVSSDPTVHIRSVRRQPSSLSRQLTLDQARDFFLCVYAQSPDPHRDAALFGCMATMGLRPGETLGLRVDDVDEAGAILRVHGKGNKERLVPLNGTVLISIQRYLQSLTEPPPPSAGLWTAEGPPLSYHGLRVLFHRYRQQAGIPGNVGGPHVFRHFFITQSLLAGADMRVVATMVGHSSIRPLEDYFHIAPPQMSRIMRGMAADSDGL